MAHPDRCDDAVLAAPTLPADRAGAPPADGHGAGGCEALLAEAHAILVRGIVRPIAGHEDVTLAEAIAWRQKYAQWRG